MFDIIIKNGIIIDGTGAKGLKADIGIKKDRIAAVEILKTENAAVVIGAEGKIICPGFIDILDHSDSFWTIFSIPRLDSKVRQGITTIIGGNCGSSIAPVIGENSVAAIQKWVDIANVNANWGKMEELFKELSRRNMGVNFGTFVGHETMRRSILGDEVKQIKYEEIKMMGRMLMDSLKDGAFGMSTGLVFSHAKMATISEIKYLVDMLKSENCCYASHIRGESEELLPSINETIQISRETGVSVEISHLKAVGERYWPDMSKALAMIDIANEENVNIDFDIYPYNTTGSVLYILLPDWVTQGGRKKMISRLKDSDLKEKIMKEMKEVGRGYENIIISICPKIKEVVGKSIFEIAEKQEMSVEEAIIELLVSANGHVIVFDKEALNEENIKLALRNSHSIVASGDAAYNIEYVRTGELVHPRCFGAFPKVLGRYVREQKVLGLENAIEKMTSKPALKIGLKERGILKKGFYADITIFDPKIIIDKADYNNPYQYPEGIEYVIINGKVIVNKGEHTGELAGRVLRR